MASTSTFLWRFKKITCRARPVLRFFWVLSSKGKKGGTLLAQVPGISRDSVAADRAGPTAQMLSLRCCSPSHLLAGLSWVSLFQGPMCLAAQGNSILTGNDPHNKKSLLSAASRKRPREPSLELDFIGVTPIPGLATVGKLGLDPCVRFGRGNGTGGSPKRCWEDKKQRKEGKGRKEGKYRTSTNSEVSHN